MSDLLRKAGLWTKGAQSGAESAFRPASRRDVPRQLRRRGKFGQRSGLA